MFSDQQQYLWRFLTLLLFAAAVAAMVPHLVCERLLLVGSRGDWPFVF